ncbi:MAG TPA: hypothetical protein VKT81_11065 [Bryobacteraceae bacterium]|nr:hypothetical protein [Bryobacteraceae bacterium]
MANEKEAKPKDQKPKEPKEPKKPKEAKAKEEAPQAAKAEEKGLLETAAQAIGSTLGTIAVKTGLAHPEPKVSQKIPKLAKKNKARLPRKEKKRARKASGGAQAK